MTNRACGRTDNPYGWYAVRKIEKQNHHRRTGGGFWFIP
jgi:hypothetical protein